MLIPISKKIKETKIEMAAQVYEILKGILYSKNIHKFVQEREHFVVVLLSRANKIRYIDIVSVGGLTSTIVEVRQVFRFAIHFGCEAIIVGHTHPSGALSPSSADKEISKKLEDAGKLLGVTVLDNLIITKNGFYSFAAHNLILSQKP